MIQSRIPIVALCGALLGCGSGTDDASEPKLGEPPRYPVPDCEAIDATPCDVRTGPCQTRLLALAACMRGEPAGELPPVTLMSEAEYTAYLNDRMSEQDPPPNPNHYERALTMLGLAAPEALSPKTVVADNVQFVWGFYRWDTKDIVMVDHGARFDEQSASPFLVHEFIHLLQDRDVDLKAFRKERATSHDSFLATDSVIEGEARLHESRYRAAALGLDPATIDWKKRFQSVVDADEAWILKEPSPYSASWRTFPYEWGARYMHFVWQAGGLAGVLGRFASPPMVAQVLMASVDGAVDMTFTPNAISAPVPPPDWAVFDDDVVLGAWQTFVVLAKHTPVGTARALALAWRGDRLCVYQETMTALPTTAMVWRIDFADEATAATAAELGREVVGPAGVRHQGVRVVMAKTDGPLPLDWAFAPESAQDAGGSPSDAGSVEGDAGDDSPDAGSPSNEDASSGDVDSGD